MKILHTSDWHIGKRLNKRERLDEQRDVLDELISVCEKEVVDLVLVAGDIFDTFLPSAEAEELFYEKVTELAGKNRAVLLISGNHDDNVRLGAATPLAERHGIYIYGSSGYIPKTTEGRKINVAEAGTNHIIFSKGEEKVFVNVLPYPNEARLKEDKNPNESFYDKISRWISIGEEKNTSKLPSVFLSHLFVAGGISSEGERDIDLGGARAIPLSLLPQSDYVALGHLHRRQLFSGNVCYSGSILQYAFDEAGMEKSFVIFDLDKSGVQNLKKVPIKSGRQLVRLSADSIEKAVELLKNYPDCLIELALYLSEPLIQSQMSVLKEANEGLLTVIPVISNSDIQITAERRSCLSAGQLFSEFYKSQYNEEPSDELKELFLSIIGESNETTSS